MNKKVNFDEFNYFAEINSARLLHRLFTIYNDVPGLCGALFIVEN